MDVVLPYICMSLVMVVPLAWIVWIVKEDIRRRDAYWEDCERIKRGEPLKYEWQEWRLW